jgi:hypothetical protein
MQDHEIARGQWESGRAHKRCCQVPGAHDRHSLLGSQYFPTVQKEHWAREVEPGTLDFRGGQVLRQDEAPFSAA